MGEKVAMANILVVGDGAIGLLYSHFLSAEHTVTVATRKNNNNSYYYQNAQEKELIQVNAATVEQLTNTKFETIIFAVKAYQVADAFKQYVPYANDNGNLVLSHNGMSDLAPLLKQLKSKQALYFLTTRLAGFKTTPTTVAHTGGGESVLGGCNEQALLFNQAITQQLNALPGLYFSQQISQIRFEKLLINIAINPLSALYMVKNGALRAPFYCTKVMNLLSEACNVARALGINIALSHALTQAYQVMSHTKDNHSSMQQDMSHNRKTEIEAMCGYISQQGKLLAIKTPYNDALLHDVQNSVKSAR